MVVIFLTVHWKQKLPSGNQRAEMELIEWKIVSHLAKSFAGERIAEASTLGWSPSSLWVFISKLCLEHIAHPFLTEYTRKVHTWIMRSMEKKIKKSQTWLRHMTSEKCTLIPGCKIM